MWSKTRLLELHLKAFRALPSDGVCSETEPSDPPLMRGVTSTGDSGSTYRGVVRNGQRKTFNGLQCKNLGTGKATRKGEPRNVRQAVAFPNTGEKEKKKQSKTNDYISTIQGRKPVLERIHKAIHSRMQTPWVTWMKVI